MSSVAHISATLRSGACSPGIVAHPCLPTYSPRCHKRSSFSATSFTALAGSWPAWTTQIGARRVTTASWAMVSAVARAVPPVTQPPQLKPTIIVSTIDATQARGADGRDEGHRHHARVGRDPLALEE